jgi:hypothetical protein
MNTKLTTWTAIAMLSAVFPDIAPPQSSRAPSTALAASEVYIQQSRGRVNPGASILTKPPPESTAGVSQSTAPTAPVTCNAQNASSQACYTATQQSRPAGR